MPSNLSSTPIALEALDNRFSRADIEFSGLDHAGASYEGRVFLNNAEASENTPRTPESGYAGCFHIFGHGGCLGDIGHCEVKPRATYDPRPAHPLTPAHKVVIATDAVRSALKAGERITVTVVPVVLSTTPSIGHPDDVLKYEQVRIVTYR